MDDGNSNLVYSTEQTIPLKKNPSRKTLRRNALPGKPQVIVRLDRKSRSGKSVTIINGLPMQQEKIEALLKQLKVQLGAGGAIKDASIEIQGDHCNILMAALKKMGYSPKRSGG